MRPRAQSSLRGVSGVSLRSAWVRLRTHAQRPVGFTFATSLAIQALNVLTGVLLARSLGPGGRGELAAIVLWPTLLGAVASLGVTESIAYHSSSRAYPLPALLGTSFGLAAVQGILATAVGVGVLPLVLSQYSASTVHEAYLFTLTIPLGLISLYAAYLLNGILEVRWFNGIRLLVIVTMAVGLVGAAATGLLTVASAVLVYVAANLVTMLVAIPVAMRYTNGVEGISRSIAGSLLRFGWRSQLSTLSNMLNERFDQLVISVVLAPAKLGLYVVAWTLTAPIGLIGMSVGMMALPAMARQDSDRARIAVARRYVSLTIVASLAVAVPAVLMAPLLIDFAFGDRFASATDSARLLLLASVVFGVSRVLGSILKGLNRPLDAGLAEGGGLVVTFAGLAVLIPVLGIVGAAITSLVAYSVTAAISLRRVTLALDADVFTIVGVRSIPPSA
jgi:O-antigen/teichoic acid export membrane protein